MNKSTFCIIMAGGIGRRFWPLSRQSYPKQFTDLLGTGKTLIQQTYERMLRVCPKENILVVTGAIYKNLTLEQLPDLTEEQILIEPARRNTAPCVAFANERIQSINPNASVIVTPSDHLILKEDRFEQIINKGIEFTKNKNALLTIGIAPNRPETDYGYVQIEDSEDSDEVLKVKNFTEKPDYELAKFFIESKEFYWNSGIYVWSLKTIKEAYEKHLPSIQELFSERSNLFGTELEEETIQNIYAGCKNISIDYGIMEKADNVYMHKADFDWSDLGTWRSLYDTRDKNEDNNVLKHDNILTYDTKNTMICTSNDKITAVQGLDGYVIAETDDALLICKRKDEGKIRQIINDIKFKKGDQYI